MYTYKNNIGLVFVEKLLFYNPFFFSSIFFLQIFLPESRIRKNPIAINDNRAIFKSNQSLYLVWEHIFMLLFFLLANLAVLLFFVWISSFINEKKKTKNKELIPIVDYSYINTCSQNTKKLLHKLLRLTRPLICPQIKFCVFFVSF